MKKPIHRIAIVLGWLLPATVFLTQTSISEAYLFPYGPANPVPGAKAPAGSVWPRPSFPIASSLQFAKVDTRNFKIAIVLTGSEQPLNCPLLDFAVNHYEGLIRELSDSGAGGEISLLQVQLSGCPDGLVYPETDSLTDEFYSVQVAGSPLAATLSANTAWGAIRGLETFYQLLWSDNDDYSSWHLNLTSITDQPRFIHRGIMIDTARHYLPENLITRLLDVLMYNKFNVLHWHVVDDQSFPFVSDVFPELSAQGAYNEAEVYTKDTISKVIEAARVRGIRVILEFDTPGHTAALGISHRELLTPCFGDGVTPGTPNFPEHAAYENLDPSNPEVYPFMRDLFSEIVNSVSKDSYLHVGMDEAYHACWESSPLIRQFMTENNYTSISQVQGHYTSRHVEMVKSLGVKPIAWQDPIDEGVELDKSVVVQMWKNWGEWEDQYRNLTSNGYNVLFSSCWYVNYIAYGEEWKNYYECDPIHTFSLPKEEWAQVLGGEAAIWGEFVDQTNIVPRLFPFASAIGSVLWDAQVDEDLNSKESTDDAAWRLDNFRCSLLRRKVRAQPILNGHCGPFEASVVLNKK